MDNNVLVIGNGYDVAHGLETKYEHFIEWVRTLEGDFSNCAVLGDSRYVERISSNGFIKYFLEYAGLVPGWIDLEHLIKAIINDFKYFFENYTEYINALNRIDVNYMKNDPYEINKIRIFYGISKFPIFEKVAKQGTSYQYTLSNSYYTKGYGLNKKAVIRLLKIQLDDLIVLLQFYLKQHYNNKRDSLKMKQQLSEINPNYIITFNYTDTYELYGVQKENVFHVHGSIALNNMVLGFDDDNPTELDFVYFKKYFQRIQKLTGYIDTSKVIKYNSGIVENAVVHFYGHSMDNTDGDIIRELKTMAKQFVIYKYNQEDYEQKVINLIAVFGKENATDMIQKGFIQFIECV